MAKGVWIRHQPPGFRRRQVTTTVLPVFLFCAALAAGMICYGLWRLKRKKESQVIQFIAQVAGIPSYRKSLPRLQTELARGRRFQRPLSVIVIRPKEMLPLVSVDGLNRVQFLLCGAMFRDALRQVDVATYDSIRNQFVIVLPESTKLQAAQAANRLTELIDKSTADQLKFGTVTFPDDGLSIEDLIIKANAPVGGIAESTRTGNKAIEAVQTYASR
jgi:hypothetical protein